MITKPQVNLELQKMIDVRREELNSFAAQMAEEHEAPNEYLVARDVDDSDFSTVEDRIVEAITHYEVDDECQPKAFIFDRALTEEESTYVRHHLLLGVRTTEYGDELTGRMTGPVPFGGHKKKMLQRIEAVAKQREQDRFEFRAALAVLVRAVDGNVTRFHHYYTAIKAQDDQVLKHLLGTTKYDLFDGAAQRLGVDALTKEHQWKLIMVMVKEAARNIANEKEGLQAA